MAPLLRHTFIMHCLPKTHCIYKLDKMSIQGSSLAQSLHRNLIKNRPMGGKIGALSLFPPQNLHQN